MFFMPSVQEVAKHSSSWDGGGEFTSDGLGWMLQICKQYSSFQQAVVTLLDLLRTGIPWMVRERVYRGWCGNGQCRF